MKATLPIQGLNLNLKQYTAVEMTVHETGVYSIIPYIYRNKPCVFTLNNTADISWQSGCVFGFVYASVLIKFN